MPKVKRDLSFCSSIRRRPTPFYRYLHQCTYVEQHKKGKAAKVLASLEDEESMKREFKADYVICIDESGRGPIAGPLAVVALCFSPGAVPPLGLRDSKKLKEDARLELEKQLQVMRDQGLLYYSICIVEREELDDIRVFNIVNSTLHTMDKVAEQVRLMLPKKAQVAYLIDGPYVPPRLKSNKLRNARALVKGDEKSCGIAAASILAKNAHDARFDEIVALDPETGARYGWANNKGYGTEEHMAALLQYGPSNQHRLTCKPVRFWDKPKIEWDALDKLDRLARKELLLEKAAM